MVIQDQNHGTASPHYEMAYEAAAATPMQKPKRQNGGLVKSRAQFFEALEALENKRAAPCPKVPPKHAVLPAFSKVVAPYPPSQPPLPVRTPPMTRVPPPPPPSSYRRHYPDSFSNDLPMIDESRQEDFPVPSRTASTKSGSPLLEVGIQHYNREEYILAEKAFMTALKTQQANMSVDDLATALIMGNLGAVYLKQNKIEHAMQFLETSLHMKKSLGKKVTMADTYNNLGNCANILGKYEKSLEYYRLALQELRQKRGRKSDVADALFNIGRLEIHRDNFQTARGVLHEALRMANEVYGENHVYVAEASDLMGFVQVSLGRHEEALISFTKGLEIYRNLQGPLHVDVANAIFNIGMVRESTKDFSDAWEAYKTAQDLYQRLGTSPEEPGFKTVRRSIAHVEKLIAQQNQARLIEKHYEAIQKKKKKKEKRESAAKDRAIAPVD